MRNKIPQEENSSKQKSLESIRKHIQHAPHNTVLCNILLEFLMQAEAKYRVELLRVIIEDFHYVESDNLYSIPIHYEVILDARLKKVFEEKINLKLRNMVRESMGWKKEEDFYTSLYDLIFNNDTFETNHERAYGLYLLCKSSYLPYVYVDFSNVKGLDEAGFEYDGDLALSEEKEKKLNFLLNSPIYNSDTKKAILLDEFKHTKKKERDLVFKRIISFYEEELRELRLFYIDKIIL